MASTERWSTAESLAQELGARLPDAADFAELADLTALRRAPDGSYYASNYLRGRLLHAVVAARRPSALIEFGTGRGYGCLSMARALVDRGIDGRVYTIDVVPDDVPLEWAFRDGAGPRTERWSRAAFWERHIPAAWRERVTSLCGRSTSVVQIWSRLELPRVEFAFVDGGHDRATARHDILAALHLSADRLGLLIDDVADRPGFGVAAAVRELLSQAATVTMVPTDWGPAARWPGAGMAWLALDGDRDRGLQDRAHAHFFRAGPWERIRGLLAR